MISTILIVAALVIAAAALIAMVRNPLAIELVNRAGSLLAFPFDGALGIIEVICPPLARLLGHAGQAVRSQRSDDAPAAHVVNDGWLVLLFAVIFFFLGLAEWSLLVLTIAGALELPVPVPGKELAGFLAAAYLVALAVIFWAALELRQRHADDEEPPRVIVTPFGSFTERVRKLLHRVLLVVGVGGLIVAGIVAYFRLELLVVLSQFDLPAAAAFLVGYSIVIALAAVVAATLAIRAPGLIGLIIGWLIIIVLWLLGGLCWIIVRGLDLLAGFIVGQIDVVAHCGLLVWALMGKRAPTVPAFIPRPPISSWVERPAFLFHPAWQPALAPAVGAGNPVAGPAPAGGPNG